MKTIEENMLTTSTEPILLNWGDKDRTMVVTPDNNDRFVIAVHDAITACKASKEAEKFELQFTLLTKTIAEWLNNKGAEVSDSYLTVRDAGFLFLVILKEAKYNSDLEDDLTDLDISIAQDPLIDLIDLSVLAIPNAGESATSSFLQSGQTFAFRKNVE